MLAAAAVAAGLWFGLPPLARDLDFFRLRRVEFHGTTYLTPDRLVPAIRLGDSASIFDGLDGVAERLGSVPGVRKVSVSRRIPGTLRVDIEEARPVALAPGEGGLNLVDEHGRALPFDPALAAPDLPIMAKRDSAVAGLLAQVLAVDPGLFARINLASRSRRDVVLEVDSLRYWFRPDASAEAILAVTAVAADLARKNQSYAELDGRFADQVVVVRRRRG